MHDLPIHLIPFLEMVAALVATPIVGMYVWRGVRRRRKERLARGDTRQSPVRPRDRFPS
ncbi:MAG: hypothetical protein JWL61_246 [Gemmatimonadetes bacterium]|jgi:hypothetical protein|nr:hypothetical protein [Gemmatimonadota bacterium]